MMVDPAIVCHGGAGHTAKDQPGVDQATDKGWEILVGGGSALDAAIAAVMHMEDDPVLNAGTGGKYRDDGSIQLDASIMTSDGRFGAVACIEETRNPIVVAAALLDSQLNMLVGRGARDFADGLHIPREEVVGSKRKHASDTVGAVARDSTGLIVVASSTGGCSGRPAGRVGDTPLIGAGLWCDANGGFAATGIGEAITLDMSCIRVAERSADTNVQEAMDWGLARFDESIEVGFIGLSTSGGGVGVANTGMPWAARSSEDS